MSAFTPYQPRDRLESCATQTSFRNQCSPTTQITCGAARLYGSDLAGGGLPVPALAALTLPDGRLNVGTHLPLLAGRYRYLSVLGEGVSAQVLLVEDTLQQGHLVTVKVMRRQHTYSGQREARALRYLHSRPEGGAPGIVRLLGTFMLGAHFCMVMVRVVVESGVAALAGIGNLRYEVL